jgi:multicomponent Na+:H+ antiporter subunit F
MTGDGFDVLGAAIAVTLAMLTVALALTLMRFVRGPTLIDRVVALELTATLVVGLIAAYAVEQDTPALLDVAIALALVVYIGAVAFARYAERAVRR